MQLSSLSVQRAAPPVGQSRPLRPGFYLVLSVSGAITYLGSDITEAALYLDAALDHHVVTSSGYWIGRIAGIGSDWDDDDFTAAVYARLETLAGLCH